jgi:hypothetical protein
VSESADAGEGLDLEPPERRIDTTVAHNARVWDYWLGGRDNFAVDREVGDHIRKMLPIIGEIARADRQFLARAISFLAGEAGIRQFLDIGTGLPTANNTHEVAQSIAPESRIVYVDNDAKVLAHARALLTGGHTGAMDYIDADVHEPDAILASAARTLDFTQPVAVVMLGILNFVLDNDVAESIVRRLMDAVPSGSYLALTHPTADLGGEMQTEAMAFWNENATPPVRTRTGEEIARYFEGLELLEPGLVSCALWRPETSTPESVPQYGAVARKP